MRNYLDFEIPSPLFDLILEIKHDKLHIPAKLPIPANSTFHLRKINAVSYKSCQVRVAAINGATSLVLNSTLK